MKYILTFFLICFAFIKANDIEVVEDFLNNVENISTNSNKRYVKVVKKSVTVSKKIVRKDTAQKIYTQKVEKKTIKKVENISKKNKVSKVNKKFSKKSKKVIIAIVIDDITKKSQIDFLKSLPYKVTPSIFPPNKMNMHTPKLAKNLKHFMIHLPLQSASKSMNKMYKTLFIYDSDKKIKNRVSEIRKLFPTAKYVNNHTGSVFTANYKKSKVLYKALMDNGFIFLDSRTTQHSKIKKIAKEFHKRYLKNDIFIDNTQNVTYSLKQLKEGIKLAKERGYAIVIGHPHPTTLKALKKLKPYLKGVKTVYIDEF